MADEALVTKVRHELRRREAFVASVTRPSPRVVRLTVSGPDLHDLDSQGPMDHVKLLFTEEHEDTHREARRDYTLRRLDAAAGWVEIDVVTHAPSAGGPAVTGLASSWAERAQVGDRVAFAGPKSSKIIRPGLAEHVLAVDDTGLPMAYRWLAEAPADAHVTVFAEVQDERDVQAMPSAATTDIRWLYREKQPPGTSTLLVDSAVAYLTETRDDGLSRFVVVAAEAVSIRGVKRFLREDAGLPRDAFQVTGYWRRGVAGHDHHAPID